MFYAASEIVFWILLAAIAGGGIGYGLAQAKLVRLNKRLTQSRADAPMERELAIAWDTIEDLNRRLQVAHETIRHTAGAEDAEGADEAAVDATLEPPPAKTPDPAPDDADSAVVEMVAPKPRARATSNGSTKAKKPAARKTKTTRKTAAKAAPKTAAKKTAAPAANALSDDTVGTRLSERVASASLANNQVDFTDGE